MTSWSTLGAAGLGALLGVTGMYLVRSEVPGDRGSAVATQCGESCEAAVEDCASERRRVEHALANALEEAADLGDNTRAGTKPNPPPPILFGPGTALSLVQRERAVQHRYGALFRELGLSPEDTARARAVLSDQEERAVGSSDEEAAARRREQDALTSAIGREKAERFSQLKASLPARSELRRVRDRLEEAGEPMSGEQQRALVAVMSSLPGSSPRPIPGESLEQGIERFRSWTSERDRAFRERASDILSEGQQRTLEEAAELREAQAPQLRASALGVGRAGSGG
jgi:hypothetical protein